MEDLYVNRNKQINRLAYALLALFLGTLGVHKFYAGFVGRGVLYLFLSLISLGIITAITSFCTFIKALTVKGDADGNIYLDNNSKIVG